MEDVLVTQNVVVHGDLRRCHVLFDHDLETPQCFIRECPPGHSFRKGREVVAMRRPHHNPLDRVHASEQSDFHKRRAHLEDTTELEQRPVPSSGLKGEQGDSIAPQFKEDLIVDRFCDGVDKLVAQQRPRLFDDTLRYSTERLI